MERRTITKEYDNHRRLWIYKETVEQVQSANDVYAEAPTPPVSESVFIAWCIAQGWDEDLNIGALLAEARRFYRACYSAEMPYDIWAEGHLRGQVERIRLERFWNETDRMGDLETHYGLVKKILATVIAKGLYEQWLADTAT